MSSAVPSGSARLGRAMLRIPAARYLAAELITFGCLFTGTMLAREARPAGGPPGTLIALMGGTILTNAARPARGSRSVPRPSRLPVASRLHTRKLSRIPG
jgi:hypothetical protein